MNAPRVLLALVSGLAVLAAAGVHGEDRAPEPTEYRTRDYRAPTPAGLAGVVNDAIALYFSEPAFAHAFVARFCCGYRVETIKGAFAVRRDELPARRDALVHKTP